LSDIDRDADVPQRPPVYVWRVKPARSDVLLALGVALLAALEVRLNSGVEPKWAALVTEVPFALALMLRRQYPILCVAIVSVGVGLEPSLGVPPDQPVVPLLALVISLYSLGAYRAPKRAALGSLAIVPGFAVGTSHISGDSGARFGNFAFGLIICGGAWFAGAVIRARTQHAGELARKADRLETESLAAVAEERARIARELHDVIAHSVSVMVVQAGAAAAVLEKNPERAAESLQAVQDTGRQALVEMSRLVGLLREHGEEIGLTPQPGLADVGELVEQVREAGLAVELHIEGEARPLPLGIDLSAYRVLQEALTNTLKHAGQAKTQVHVRYGRDALELEVLDDGASPANAHTGGHGLIGMRERVSVFGGDLQAGPRPEGGFAVRTRLPITAESP
jgi:signal transduction histidine kinase